MIRIRQNIKTNKNKVKLAFKVSVKCQHVKRNKTKT